MEQQYKDSMTPRTLAMFFAMAFALTWGIAALLISFTDQIEAIFGELDSSNPLFILAVHSPGIAGIFLVWWHTGFAGLASFFKRLTLAKMSAAWWLLLIFGIPAAFYIGTMIKGNFGEPFPFDPWQGVFPALAAALFLGPIEEFGWRGLAQPVMQRYWTPFWTSIALGIIWAIWHIPAFFLSGVPQSSWSFPAFFVGVVALSVILTPMFNAARGSLLIAVLFHFQCMGPAWPDAQPWDTPVFVLIAVVVVYLNRKSLFRPGGEVGGGVTEVLSADG